MSVRIPKAFTKHRRASLRWAVDFTNPLARRGGSPTLQGTPVVKVSRRNAAGGWTDVTAEFGIGNEVVSSPTVAFDIGAGAAAAGQTPATQDAGDYVIRVECPISNGENLVTWHTLTVHEDGDPEAPT